MKTKILVAIATLNEAKNIGGVITGIKAAIEGCDVLVIDGYSCDNTSFIASNYGAKVIKIDSNFGIGLAIESAISYAHYKNYDFLIRMDGDGQHPPTEIIKLFKSVENINLTIGSRFLGSSDYKPSLVRLISIKSICWLLKYLHGVNITDCTSGCQIYNKILIEKLYEDKDFEYSEIRIICLVKKMNLTIQEVFINMAPRQFGASSFVFFNSLVYMFKNIVDIIVSTNIKVDRN